MLLECFLSKITSNRTFYSAEAVFYAWNPNPNLLYSCREIYIGETNEMNTVILRYYTKRWISIYIFL